jgi:hypothetical protein
MPSPAKKTLLLLAAVGFLAVTLAGVSRWREATRPKRIWVRYSEKSISEANGDNYGTQIGETEDLTLQTEEKLLMGFRARGDSCMVLTHDKATADYRATVSVTRTPGSVDNFGDAKLSVVRRNGDVVASKTFSQYRSFGEQDDIGEQPIKALANLLCKKEKK